MTVPPTLSLTESQTLAAIRAFLLAVATPATGTLSVIRAQVNRVPEPLGDFIVMTPLLQQRLATNLTLYYDDIITGSIAGTTLTVTAVSSTVNSTSLAAGMTLIDDGWPTMRVAADTVIVAQLSGTPGGVGTYTVSPAQSLDAETLYVGTRTDKIQANVTVQLDVHGPNSGNNVRVIDALFRSEYGTAFFENLRPALDVAPLYCDDARETPFVNAEAQYEWRWSLDAHLQTNVTIGTPQQFATQVVVQTIEAGVVYTGPDV